jgi:hypothetical protein
MKKNSDEKKEGKKGMLTSFQISALSRKPTHKYSKSNAFEDEERLKRAQKINKLRLNQLTRVYKISHPEKVF